ncbi:hypothetical protein SAMN04487910_1382 [Aquimarina amphilecti]|uniref:YD repeat-containing protein n=1 Tax=Aquimarina amphilecti TaxID=1038014 RepID=A0A1H7KP24_AQUAM|nr:hypothetical protein [Aquimarina amphilecti]SEK88314.1 hypothetical protein SAMN04487910_1382 [Aquimarina amphilecti]
MKKLLFLSAITIFASCDSDSVSDEFDNANGDAAKKLIESVEFNPAQIDEEDQVFTVNYDANNNVTSASSGAGTVGLVYENDGLSTVTGDGDPFSISELYQDPYDAFETGDVLEYDTSGNPISISVLEEYYEYNQATGEYEETIEEYIATITYDATPNPYFYTFEAAGLIEVLDRVQLNFSMMPQSSEIVRARALFPLNNIKSIVYKDEDGEVVGELKIEYVYDADNYPTSATLTVIDEDELSSVYTMTYNYKQ